MRFKEKRRAVAKGCYQLGACSFKTPVVEAALELARLVMPPDPVHGFGHVSRVADLACEIASRYEGVDYEVLLVAAYLHDIGRIAEPENHAARSASIARYLLRLLGYPDEKAERVVEAILAHSYSSGYAAASLEARILSDADKLDALGSVGLARVLMYSGEIGRDMLGVAEHIRVKLLRLPEYMYTEEGRAEAERRVRLLRDFLDGLLRELRAGTP